jgi:hypothetical protein
VKKIAGAKTIGVQLFLPMLLPTVNEKGRWYRGREVHLKRF